MGLSVSFGLLWLQLTRGVVTLSTGSFVSRAGIEPAFTLHCRCARQGRGSEYAARWAAALSAGIWPVEVLAGVPTPSRGVSHALHVIQFTIKIVRIKGLARLTAVFGFGL